MPKAEYQPWCDAHACDEMFYCPQCLTETLTKERDAKTEAVNKVVVQLMQSERLLANALAALSTITSAPHSQVSMQFATKTLAQIRDELEERSKNDGSIA